jgi:hypothetical protein
MRFAELNQMWRARCTTHGFSVLGAEEPVVNADVIVPDETVDQMQTIADGLLLQGGIVVVLSISLEGNRIDFPYFVMPTATLAAGGGC